ncbi:MAG: hypothetical protein AB1730_21825 [Myxococcota bacterium]|jgi:hypothetical protein
MRIKTEDLRRVANVLFDHLERTGHSEVDVDKDFYWSIPDRQLYSPYEKPTEFTLGQLSDDHSELEQILSGRREPIAYALVWLAALIRYVGSKTVA